MCVVGYATHTSCHVIFIICNVLQKSTLQCMQVLPRPLCVCAGLLLLINPEVILFSWSEGIVVLIAVFLSPFLFHSHANAQPHTLTFLNVKENTVIPKICNKDRQADLSSERSIWCHTPPINSGSSPLPRLLFVVLLSRISLSHLHARLAHIPVPLVPSSDPADASPTSTPLVLVVAVDLLALPLGVALIEHHKDPHHPRRHRAGREDDETNGDEEEVVPVAEALVAVHSQLHAYFRQTLARQLRRIEANCLSLVWRWKTRMTEKEQSEGRFIRKENVCKKAQFY